jgi:uncharacterized membrane protein YqjE
VSDGSSGATRGEDPRSAGGMKGGLRGGGPQNIATAITDVSERFAVLVHEEIELAKAEVGEKTAKLARGAIVGVAAGVFLVTALFFALIGFALLIYYALPVGAFAYFWGFFAMAAILVFLGVLAGLIAARVVKRGSPPTPQMAIEEARKIRESIGATGDGGGTRAQGAQGAQTWGASPAAGPAQGGFAQAGFAQAGPTQGSVESSGVGQAPTGGG